MNKQAQFQEERQIGVVCDSQQNLHSAACVAAAPLTEFQGKESLQFSVIASNEPMKLTISNNILILKKLHHEPTFAQRRLLLNAKVHSSSSKPENNLTTTLKSNNCENNNNKNEHLEAFSVNSLAEVGRHVVVSIEDSRVNIYALKKLVKILSKQLVHLKLQNCTFYESDKEAINDSNPCTNNKMLRELAFAFLVRALELPQIESIEILLNNEILDESPPIQTRKQSLLKPKTNEEKQLKLVEKYKCKQHSEFIEYEMGVRKQLLEKYKKYSNESQLVYHIITGNHEGKKDEIEESINQSIVNNIKEYTQAFSKYIKGSLVNSDICIINGYCLEDPIAFSLVQSLILKNKKKIKTIVFKGTGTIPHASYLRVIDLLLQINFLESIAFFDSQPEFDSKSYALLKELHAIKSFKHIVLNRSSFDIAKYRHQTYGQDEKQDLETVRGIKHYAFYIVDKDQVLEFTPYEFCIRDLLFRNKGFEDEQELNNELQKYDVGKLIERQQRYEIPIQKEIKKYEHQVILTQEGESEKVLLRYQQNLNSVIKSNFKSFDQAQLESGIKTLMKHPSMYSTPKANQLIEYIADPNEKQRLLEKCPFLEGFENPITFSRQGLEYVIQQQTSLVLSPHLGYFLNKSLVINGYPIKDFLKQTELESDITIRRTEKSDELGQKLISISSDLLGLEIKGIHLQFEEYSFSIYVICQRSQSKQVIRKYTVIYNFEWRVPMLGSHPEIFTNFFSSVQSQTQFDISFTSENNFARYLADDINSAQLNPNLRIKYFKMLACKAAIENNCFLRDSCLEVISFEKCYISSSFSAADFKYLKCVEFLDCSYQDQQNFIEKLISHLPNKEEEEKICLQEQTSEKVGQGGQLVFRFGWKLDIPNFIKKPTFQDQLTSLLSKYPKVVVQIFLIPIDEEGVPPDFQEFSYRSPHNLNQKLFNQIYFSGAVPLNNTGLNNATTKSSDIENKQPKQSHQNEIGFLHQKLKDLYLSNPELDSHLKWFHTYSRNRVILRPDCCREDTHNDPLAASFFDMSQNPNGYCYSNFCLPKISIFQNPLNLRKVEIKFYENLLLNQPLIYDYSEMRFIEELSFKSNQTQLYTEIGLLNFIIKSSPHLKVFKLDIDLPADFSTSISFHQDCLLKELSIRSPSGEGVIPLLEAALQSNLSELVTLKLMFRLSHPVVEQLIEKVGENLRELRIKDLPKDESIMKFLKLEKLYLDETDIEGVKILFCYF